jgi:DNA polymerase III sliding clamp (beta) subunit (PCNA family)
METKIEVPAKYLEVLKLFSARNDMRHYLGGVHVEIRPEGIFLDATDGHIYGCFHVESEESETVPHYETIIPVSLLDGLKFGKGLVTISFSGIESVDINYGTLSVHGELMVHVFPSLRNVIPKVVTGKPAQFDFRLLARLEKARTILRGKNDGSVVLGYNGEDGPSIVYLGEENFTGLIMPLRGVEPIKTFPDWFLSYVLGENHAT